jgi:hypothetical protein
MAFRSAQPPAGGDVQFRGFCPNLIFEVSAGDIPRARLAPMMNTRSTPLLRKAITAINIGIINRPSARSSMVMKPGASMEQVPSNMLMMRIAANQTTTRIRDGSLEADTTWVEPRFDAEVTYAEITNDGMVRHPVFKALHSHAR